MSNLELLQRCWKRSALAHETWREFFRSARRLEHMLQTSRHCSHCAGPCQEQPGPEARWLKKRDKTTINRSKTLTKLRFSMKIGARNARQQKQKKEKKGKKKKKREKKQSFKMEDRDANLDREAWSSATDSPRRTRTAAFRQFREQLRFALQ